MAKCQYHVVDSAPCLDAAPTPHPDVPPFRCTRPRGHKGEHVACGAHDESTPAEECAVAVWATLPDGSRMLGVREVSAEEMARAEAIAMRALGVETVYDALPEGRRRLLN